MFARILEFPVWMERKEEFVALFKNEVLPILKKQSGFLRSLHCPLRSRKRRLSR